MSFDAWTFAILSQSFLFQVCSCLERNVKAIFLIFGQTAAVIIVFLVCSENEGLFPTKFIFFQIISSFLLLLGGRRKADEREGRREGGKRKEERCSKGGGGNKEGVGGRGIKEEGRRKEGKKKKKRVPSEDWKGIVEEFPTGVVILSEKREILFKNQILLRLLELEDKEDFNEEYEEENEEELDKKDYVLDHLIALRRAITSKDFCKDDKERMEGRSKGFGEGGFKVGGGKKVSKLNSSVPMPTDMITERIGTEDHLLIDNQKNSPSLYFHMVKELGILEEIQEKESDDFEIFGMSRRPGSSSVLSELSSFSILSPSQRKEKKMKSLVGGHEGKIGTSLGHGGSFGYGGSSGYEECVGRGGGGGGGKAGERGGRGGREGGGEQDEEKKINFGADLKNLDGILDDVLKSKRSKTIDFPLPHKNKKNPVRVFCSQFKNISKMNHRNYELKIQEIYYNDQPSFLLIIQDVSYRNIVSELRQNNDYKTKVLTTLSHELRTPLNG